MLPLILFLQSLKASEPGESLHGPIISPGGFALGLQADVRLVQEAKYKHRFSLKDPCADFIIVPTGMLKVDEHSTMLASNSGQNYSPATKMLATAHKSD